MIRTLFSNRTEQLLAALAEDLRRFRAERGPWEAPHLVFPSPAMRDYVLRGLARSDLKVAANLRTDYLDGFWRRFVPGGGRPVRLLDRPAIQGLLLGLFQEEPLLEEPVLAPVRAYLSGQPRDLKALQLAEALARLFEAYGLVRPEWLEAWNAGRAAATHAPEGMEAWQRRLWTALRAKLASLPETWTTLAEFFRSPRFGSAAFPAEVFLFGLGPFARAYHEAIGRLGRDSRVNLYATIPCREIWDDLRGEWDQHAGEEEPFATDTRAHLALQRWGRAGREQVCQLCELTDWDVDLEAEESGGDRLLQRLQDEILPLGNGEPRPLPPAADDSVRVLACPGPRREAEAVADEIWETLLAARGGIRFSDVAVLLPEGAKEDYLDHLEAAFAEARRIPWRLADRGPGLVRELAEGALLLLKLGLSDLNRAQVVRALGHPAFRRRWPDLPLEDLPEFCERAGIIARMDAAETERTYLAPGLWTWTRGFERAALGCFAGGGGALDLPDGRLPAALPVAGSADLALLLGSLLADLRRMKEARQAPRAWAGRFRTFLRAYLGRPEADAGEAEARAMAALADALARLEALEVPGVVPPALGFREAVASAEASFRRLLADAPGPFGRGVAVASHEALRGIPFKVVFLMGMGEGVFPASDVRDPLDLRLHRRRPGDLKRSEQDRHLFLECLLAARERLVLSYVARDAVTGEELQPSPLVLDLRDILLPALGARGWEALQVRHRTHRHDLAYFPDLAPGGTALPASHTPAAREEAEALWIGERLRAAAGGLTELPGPFGRWGLGPAAREALAARVRSCGPLAPAPGPEALPDRPAVRVGALRKWLECQIQGGARLRLGLRGEDDRDPAEVSEEPFGTGFLDLRGAARAALWESLATGRPAGEAFLARMARLREDAKAPAGFLGEGETAAALAQIEGWARLVPPGTAPRVYRFGPGPAGTESPLEVVPLEPVEVAVDFGGRPVVFRLEGATEPQGEDGALLLADRELPEAGKPPVTKDRRDLLKAWFDQLLLAAGGIKEGAHQARVFAWRKGEGQVRAVALPPVSRAEAKARLAAWLREAFASPRWTLMPIEAVLELRGAGEGAQAMETWLDKQESGQNPSYSSRFGPLPRACEAPVEPCWRELAEARLGAFPAWSADWEEIKP